MSVWNIAHRGGAGLRPENTLAAFRHAVEIGADGAELDVQLSKDGHVVVVHDYHLNPEICRGGGGSWIEELRPPLIRDLTLQQMGALDVGRLKPGSGTAQKYLEQVAVDGERIPTLKEVIEIATSSSKPFRLFIELKTSAENPDKSASPKALAEAVIKITRQKNFLDRSIFVGFDWRGLRHIKRIAPDAECWFSTSAQSLNDRSPNRSNGDRFSAAVLHEIKFAGGEGWFPAFNQINSTLIDRARRLELRIGVWTVNDAPVMRDLVEAGVDAICTDRPDILASLISNHSLGLPGKA